MAYDPRRGVVVMHGGQLDIPGKPVVFLSDTWLWDGKSRTWSSVTTSNPPTLRGLAGAFDFARGVFVIFGSGINGPETWIWDGTRWMQARPQVQPPARGAAVIQYDSIASNLVLFGGVSGGAGVLGDTWIWNGASWIEQHPVHNPPPRHQAVLAALPSPLLFGGFGGPTGVFGDTWIWKSGDWQSVATSLSPTPRGGASAASDGQHVYLFGGADARDRVTDSWEWQGDWTRA
jgi:hypothetical protein